MFKKHQRAILGLSSSDSVAILGKKIGNIFSWVLYFFLKKKASQNSCIFDQNKINFTIQGKKWKAN